MSNYSDDPEMVRVDFFKPIGKWYATESIRFIRYKGLIQDAFRDSLDIHLENKRYNGMTAVCLNPYHEHSYPLMIKV